jgi:hypothetical protein
MNCQNHDECKRLFAQLAQTPDTTPKPTTRFDRKKAEIDRQKELAAKRKLKARIFMDKILNS